MSAESKFEKDLLNASPDKKPKEENEVDKTVDSLLKSTLAGMGIDTERVRQAVKEAEEAKKESLKPKPPMPAAEEKKITPSPRADVIDLKPQEKSAKAEPLPWRKEPPKTPPSPKKPESPFIREKAEPFPPLKKEGPFLDSYAKEKKKSKPMVPLIAGGLVVVVAVAAILIFSGGKEKASVKVNSTVTGAKLSEESTGPGTETSDLAKSDLDLATPSGKTALESTAPKEKATLVDDRMSSTETTTAQEPAPSAAPLVPIDVTTSRVQEIKLSRTETTPAMQNPQDAAGSTATPPAAKPKVTLGQLIPIEQCDTRPTLVRRVEPDYPPMAKRMNINGQVTLNALIDETGSVIRTEVLKPSGGPYGFEEKSREAVMKWKYKPAVKEGTYVKVWMAVVVTFNIKR